MESKALKLLGHTPQRTLLAHLKSQTLLFSGPEAVGRRTTAEWWMYTLNCQGGSAPCGNCASCLTPLDQHSDYRLIRANLETRAGKQARKPQIRLEQIAPREPGEESLLEWIATYPRYRAKVAVIDGAHLLGEPAANALLKLLEEPPAYARLVLVAPSRELILPTLASRSLELTFAPLPADLLATLTTDSELLRFAEGAVGRLEWALAHPTQLAQLQARLAGVRESLMAGPAPTQEALRALSQLEGGWGLLNQLEAPAHVARLAWLEAIAQAQEAYAANAAEELIQAWLALRLWRLAEG